MLVPSTRVVFEGSSKEYYNRLKTVAASRMTGCVRLVFADFEGTIIFKDGRAITALQEAGMWMALGDELIPPLENKATVTQGTMAIYELTPGMIGMFEGRKIGTTVETDIGREVTASMLVDNLGSYRSTCILKMRGQAWTGYVFFAWGKVAGASFVSDKERLYGDAAIAQITKTTGKAIGAIYFLEGGATYVEVTPSVAVSEQPMIDQLSRASTPVEEDEIPPVKAGKPGPAHAAKPPVEILHPPVAKTAPVEKVIVKPEPAEKTATTPAPVEKVIVRPEQAPVQPKLVVQSQMELTVATAHEVKLRHPSRQEAREALEERNVAWVDGATMVALGMKGEGMAILALPGGRSHLITLLKVEIIEGENVIIFPKKLRRRLAVAPGNRIVLHA